MAWSHHTGYLASASRDGTVKIWEFGNCNFKCLSTLKGRRSWRWKGVESVAWSYDDNRLASGSRDGTVNIWNFAKGKCELTLSGHSSRVITVAWSHPRQDFNYVEKSDQLATGSRDNTVKIWYSATGRCISTLRGHQGPVHTVVWAHDNNQLASVSYDNTIKIWDLLKGECISTLDGHRTALWYVAWLHAKGQRRLALSSETTMIKIWDPATGVCMSTLEGHLGAVHSMAWGPRHGHFSWGKRYWNCLE